MVQSGDRILFIENTSLRNKPLNEINQILKNCEEVVKLKIRKDEVFPGNFNMLKIQFKNKIGL